MTDLLERAKELKIPRASTMKPETLALKIAEIEQAEFSQGVDVQISKKDLALIENMGVKPEWLEKLANQYGFDCFQYLGKFKAFRCYKDGVHVDWIDVNDLSLLNGGRRLTEILLKHQPVSPNRRIIQYHWR